MDAGVLDGGLEGQGESRGVWGELESCKLREDHE